MDNRLQKAIEKASIRLDLINRQFFKVGEYRTGIPMCVVEEKEYLQILINLALSEVGELDIPVPSELIKTLQEYIVLLGKELDEVVPMASVHGWKSSRFEEGKKMREKIDNLITKRGGVE